MTTPSDKLLLSRPPRLSPDGSGYDWHEFDRWLQKIYTMLGLVVGSAPYNIPEEIKNIQSMALLSTYDTLSNDITPQNEEMLKQLLFDVGRSQEEDVLSTASLLTSESENPTWENRIKAIEGGSQWPIGSIFISIDSANPATILGFGTWTAFATGRMLVGIDPGDTDFDVPEETGGAKTHSHSVDVGNTTSGVPSATVNAVTVAGTTAVGDGTHTHNVDPGAVTSTTVSNMPPFIAVYLFKRTA